jgi:hypothetical protein
MGVFLPLDTLNHESLVLKLVMVVIQFHYLASEDKFVFIWDITFDSVVPTLWVRCIRFFFFKCYIYRSWSIG